MKLFNKLCLAIFVMIPVIGYADDYAKYCPEGQNVHSTQSLNMIRISGLNFENVYFFTDAKIGINANDAPSVWYDNFKFTYTNYDPSTKKLICNYTATYHVYGQSEQQSWVNISNTGTY